jgi:hypothetical protein
MKYENIAQIGQVIRSMDFASTDEHYIQGTVIDKGWILHPQTGHKVFKGYTIQIEDEGPHGGARVGDTGYVPFETTFDFDNRVQLAA